MHGQLADCKGLATAGGTSERIMTGSGLQWLLPAGGFGCCGCVVTLLGQRKGMGRGGGRKREKGKKWEGVKVCRCRLQVLTCR